MLMSAAVATASAETRVSQQNQRALRESRVKVAFIWTDHPLCCQLRATSNPPSAHLTPDLAVAT
jgi:hypothetical protein